MHDGLTREEPAVRGRGPGVVGGQLRGVRGCSPLCTRPLQPERAAQSGASGWASKERRSPNTGWEGGRVLRCPVAHMPRRATTASFHTSCRHTHCDPTQLSLLKGENFVEVPNIAQAIYMSPNIVLNPFSTVTPGNSVLLCHTHSRMTARHGPLTDVDTTRLLPLADESLTPCGIFLSQVQPHVEMEGEYKKIILLKGLEPINDYQFSIVKSVLARDLGLTANMQEEYNKVKIADLMEKKFPGVACVNKLIDLFKEMPSLTDIVKQLRNEKVKAAKKTKATEETPRRKRPREGAGPAPHAPTAGSAVPRGGAEGTRKTQKRNTATKELASTKKNKGFGPPTQPTCHSGANPSAATGFMGLLPQPHTSSSTPWAAAFPENQMVQGQHQGAARGRVLQKDPLTVLVLKATEPFEYECPEEGRSRMFHATVATSSQFFQVKVLNSNLKEKFTKENILTISDYFECKGILEINKTSYVYEADPFQVIAVPNSITKRANETPKIDNLYKQASGTFVYGLFPLTQIKVNRKTTIYTIQDNTGAMEVLGTGRWHNIPCKEGDKLRLFYFQLKTIDQKLKLTCGTHSFIQVGTG
uniref:Myeloid cell nuclear differentiation antigen n=1 Tax=Canis lupus familiaris TaxID=9615 RepID=A0A8I3NXV2_CANLF